MVAVEKLSPAKGKILRIESTPGGQGFQQHKGLVSVMREISTVHGGMVGLRARVQECFDASKVPGYSFDGIDPVHS